jgi:hypothetical protein
MLSSLKGMEYTLKGAVDTHKWEGVVFLLLLFVWIQKY